MHPSTAVLTLLAASAGSAEASAARPADDTAIEEVVVYGVTPSEGARRRSQQIPRLVQSASAADLAGAQSTDLTDFMARGLASVSINSAQGNPLQPDLQFRGYTASPLLGLPQGLAVYQDGARLNEPLGDAVNWDLVPVSAIHAISLMGGANPLFGLNSLGGAVTIEMKNGFNVEGHQGELRAGSHGRRAWTAESGRNNGTVGYYVNVSRFDEDGWRDASPSDARNGHLSLGWRDGGSSLDLGINAGDTHLTGNGAAPVGLLARDRDAVFTAPDVTDNDALMFTLEGRHVLSDRAQIFGSAFHRRNRTRSFNGDASELTVCRLGGRDRLVEGLEADDLEELGLELGSVCDGSFADVDALAVFLEARDPEGGPHLEDLTDQLSGTGTLSGEAINNRSARDQESRGFDIALETGGQWLGAGHELVVGTRHHRGEAAFRATVELAELEPATRSTRGLGLGTFLDGEATDVRTRTESWSLYALDTVALGEAFSLSLGGRFDHTEVTVRDRSGRRPEVEGDHDFQRFNPTVGVTWQATDGFMIESFNVYAGYAQSSRAPTPIELTCNESVFERARQRAAVRGEDPDDVDFECRLPNAFVADPPLDQVVTSSVELGARGITGPVAWHVGLFRQINRNDIVFQTTGRATGVFDSIERTRRRGLEATLHGSWKDFGWSLAYTRLLATFEDTFAVQSPSHPAADDSGRIRVTHGDRIPGIPEHQLKAGGEWQITPRLTAGVDLMHFSGSPLRGDEINELGTTGAYTVLDLRAAYRLNAHLAAFVRMGNVLNADYENFGLVAEDPSEVLPELQDTRPLFLSPGPPRAGWVGIRLRL